MLADTIPGIRVVKAFAQEQREAERFREANRHNLAINDRLEQNLVFVFAHRHPADRSRPAGGWAFGIWQISRGDITVGVLTAFLAYISRFTPGWIR